MPGLIGSAELIVRDSLDQVRRFIRASKASSTVRGYQSDWIHFGAWCQERGAAALPTTPETVAAYIADCAGWLKPGSIQRRLNAIAEAHKAMGKDSPVSAGIVRNTFKGIKRAKGTAPAQKSPVLTEDVRSMVAAVDAGLMGLRDRAVVLVGFAGAFRRSELVALNVEDLVEEDGGLAVIVRQSKTDQEGAGQKVGIVAGEHEETCPIRSVRAWLAAAGIKSGSVFRAVDRRGQAKASRLSGIDVARIVKKLAERAGLDAAKYSGHSLRAGHVTAAAIEGVPERIIMNQTRHRSTEMLRRYVRDANVFRENSSGKIGL